MTCKGFLINILIHFFITNLRKILFFCLPDWACPLKDMDLRKKMARSSKNYKPWLLIFLTNIFIFAKSFKICVSNVKYYGKNVFTIKNEFWSNLGGPFQKFWFYSDMFLGCILLLTAVVWLSKTASKLAAVMNTGSDDNCLSRGSVEWFTFRFTTVTKPAKVHCPSRDGIFSNFPTVIELNK